MIYFLDQCFYYQNETLYIESVSSLDILKSIRTPFYCYSKQAIKNNYDQFVKNLPHNTLICYAVKANPNLSIMKLLADLGAGAEVVSEGELRRAILAGIPEEKIVFSGVGKTKDEIQYALDCNIYQFNVESIEELHLINNLALAKNKVVNLSLRINPDIDAYTNNKITTGLKINKFGITEENILSIFNSFLPGVRIVGLSMHIGSQISSLKIFDSMIKKMKGIINNLKQYDHKIERIDVGGGLGIPYKDDDCFPTIVEYSQLLKKHFYDVDYQIICEPGRALVGNSGILFTKVLYCKYNDEVRHIVVDAGMNDFMRTALYDVHHMVIPIVKKYCESEVVDIVGPVCESDDIFAHKINMQKISSCDFLAICTVGAYGSSMFNNYNSRPLIAELLVDNNKFYVIRRRQTYEEMFECELSMLK